MLASDAEDDASVGSATVVTAQTVTPGSISSMKTIRSSGIGRCARWAGWRRHSLCKEKTNVSEIEMIDDMDVILERLTLSSHEKTLVRADAGFGVSLSDEDVGDLPSRSPSPSPAESFDAFEPSADHWERRSSPSRSPEGVRRGTGAGGSLQTTGLAPYMTKEVQGLRNRHRRMRYDLQALRENQAVMNGTLNQIRVGQDCDILEFADWCANCSAHIIVVSLTNSAVEPQASVGSATVVTAQTVTPGSISWQLVDVPWQLAGMALVDVPWQLAGSRDHWTRGVSSKTSR